MQDDEYRINFIKKKLADTSVGSALVAFANAKNISIEGKDLWRDSSAGIYFSDEDKIELDLGYSDIMVASVLGHEIVHAWQNHMGLFSFSSQSFAACVVHVRLYEAVAHGVQSIIAKELKRNKFLRFVKPQISAKEKSEAFHRGFNRIAGQRLKFYDEKSIDVFLKHPVQKLCVDSVSAEIQNLQASLPDMLNLYGAMSDGLNIFEETGGFDAEQVKTIFAPLSNEAVQDVMSRPPPILNIPI